MPIHLSVLQIYGEFVQKSIYSAKFRDKSLLELKDLPKLMGFDRNI